MKVFAFAVVLLLFVVNEINCLRLPAALAGTGPNSGYELLNSLNELDVHYLHNCGECKETNAIPIQAWMGPCMNTPTCKIPFCCGIISGVDSFFRFNYTAGTALKGGVFNGNCGGIGLGSAVPGTENLLAIELPVQFTVPPTLAGYKRTLCDQTTCPQVVGQNYTLEIPFRFVTTVMDTMGIKTTFVAQIYNELRQQVMCWGLWAELVNPNLLPSVFKTVETVVKDPVWALGNLGDKSVLGGPLVGLIGNKEWKHPFPDA